MKTSLPDIHTHSIPHNCQRYNTAGDYFESDNAWEFRISKLGDWRFEVLVIIHELVEKVLCKNAGVEDADIDKFDIQFEKDREAGSHTPTEEPGDDKRAPYHRQHVIASRVEKIVARAAGVRWRDYNAAINSL
jgi:hypothetical protein